MRSRSTLVHRFLIVAMLLQMAAPLAAVAQAPVTLGAAQAPFAAVEGITEYRLPNGLRVLLFPDASASTMTVNVTYLVGSRHESYGETGMAHLLEHLMFKGTATRGNIYSELSTHGGRANGTTWLDRTNYYETFPASDENLTWALTMEADRMVNSRIARKDLDSEMTVVRNEFESGENSPGRVLWERAIATAYLWHNYGHPTIGARSDIENVPIAHLQAFYRKFYQPDNAILTVAGRIDEAKTLALVQRTFGAIPRPTRVIDPTYTAEPVQDGERAVTVRRVADEQSVLAMYHVPAGPHPDFAALEILERVLGDEPGGRLHKALVETHKATSVGSSSFSLRDPGVVMFGADLRKDAPLDPARDGLLAIVESVPAHPVTDAEVDRARTALLKQVELNLTASDRVGIQISEYAAMGDWRLMYLHRDRLRSATTADVNRVAAAYLKPSNRTLAAFIPTAKPDRAEIPATPDVEALVRNYKGEKPLEAGEAFDPSPANLDRRTQLSELGGLKLALLPKKTRGGVVKVEITFNMGDEKSLFGKRTAAGLAGSMLMRGTRHHTRQQLKDALDKLKARVAVTGGATSARVYVETVRDNLGPALDFAAEMLREPSFPADEFETLKQEHLQAIEADRGEPQSIAITELGRHLSPYPVGDVRYTATPDEEIASIKATTLADVKAFYEKFYGASTGQVSAVGDFDPAALAAQTKRLFGDWKSPSSYTRVPTLRTEVAPETRDFQTPDKANAVYMAGLTLDLRDDDADYPALVLGSYMLGGGFLNSRLAMRIRQKEGLSYGVGAHIAASSLDRFGSFRIYAIYAPQSAARLTAAVREELERALKDGFTAEEVAAARKGWLQSQEVERGTDSTVLSMWNRYRFLGRTYAWQAELDRKVEALTPQQIVDALRHRLDLSKLSVIRAGDFKK